MAIIREKITLSDNREILHIYSDDNRYVVYNGDIFEHAYAPADSDRIYTEGDVIETEETKNEYLNAYKILMGVKE